MAVPAGFSAEQTAGASAIVAGRIRCERCITIGRDTTGGLFCARRNRGNRSQLRESPGPALSAIAPQPHAPQEPGILGGSCPDGGHGRLAPSAISCDERLFGLLASSYVATPGLGRLDFNLRPWN